MDNSELQPQQSEPNPENNLPEEPEENGIAAWIKNSLVFLVLFFVVIGSFWLSFQLGKRLLLPVKKPIYRIENPLAEPPAALRALQKIGTPEAFKPAKQKPALNLNLPAKVETKIPEVARPKKTIAKTTPAKAIKKAAAPSTAAGKIKPVSQKVESAPAGQYFKVQATPFSKNKQSAESIAVKVKEAGFLTYVKKTGGSWRVQIGAFRQMVQAQKLKKELQQKAINSVIVRE